MRAPQPSQKRKVKEERGRRRRSKKNSSSAASSAGPRSTGSPAWFASDQRCPECGSDRADVVYRTPRRRESAACSTARPTGCRACGAISISFRSTTESNVVTAGEGLVPIDRWEFLEEYARKRYQVRCRVYAHRQDDNYATGTFKDLSGSIVASVLRENGIRNFVASSTGNTAVAYARYLTAAGISFYAFIPENASITQAAEVGCFGQNVFRVKGDYTRTKEMAMAFARKHNMPLAGGNFDPMRIEAKKTMMLEWIRILDEFPTVYIQALSGGTGTDGDRQGLPRPRSAWRWPARCPDSSSASPAAAPRWPRPGRRPRAKGFPDGWEKTYPIYHNPDTRIATLAAGFPKTYPVLAPLVRESGGAIFAFDEEATPLIARIVGLRTFGPDRAGRGHRPRRVLRSPEDGAIRDGDRVLINIGEGIRRAPEFLATMFREKAEVGSIEECRLSDRPGYRAEALGGVGRDGDGPGEEIAALPKRGNRRLASAGRSGVYSYRTRWKTSTSGWAFRIAGMPPRKARSTTAPNPTGYASSILTRSRALIEDEPVAIRSSMTTTRWPGVSASSCFSKYSTAYSLGAWTQTVLRGSFPFFRITDRPRLRSRATGAANR